MRRKTAPSAKKSRARRRRPLKPFELVVPTVVEDKHLSRERSDCGSAPIASNFGGTVEELRRKGKPRRPADLKPLSVTIPDAISLTGIGRTVIYEKIAAGELRTTTIGKRRLVLYSSLEALLAENAR
jgi:excisionase family DNA binding protein